MKLELQLYGVAISATASSVSFAVRGGTAQQDANVRLTRTEFSQLASALGSIQEILERLSATEQAGTTPVAHAPTPAAPTEAPAAVTAGVTPKRRGRPPRAAGAAASAVTAATVATPPVAAVVSAPTPAKRGRPPKAVAAAATPAAPVAPIVVATATGAAPAKKRGRPPKSAQAAVVTGGVAAPAATAAATPKKRGRPPKSAQAATIAAAAAVAPPAARTVAPAVVAAPKKRGRPAKVAAPAVAVKAKLAAAPAADAGKRGPGRPRTDGTAVGASRLVEIVDEWMAAHPGPKSIDDLAVAAKANAWVEAAHAAEYLERHMPRAQTLFVRLPDGRFRRRADKTPIEAPKAAKVMRRRGHDEIAIVRVEAPGT